ncbi:hypothetical protein [Variovorax boronicumulans]|uniref:hypothetical protein n=1 Tax=Variovorax boronicumulans TaxID=436515 RepID=UPI00278051AC|nr:hypothetical protein [Variovorax boronicumulans]MDQ0042802.1 hypothetical protein [Variovorax boronicumulans]
MQLFKDELPPGLWLIKWIDRFQFGHNAEAAKVGVSLQKLPINTVEELDQLTDDDVKVLLGTPPRWASTSAAGQEQQQAFIGRLLLAAYLPQLQIGYVIEATRCVGRLRSKEKTVQLDYNTVQEARSIGDERAKPADWTVNAPYRVLNSFEYRIAGGIAEVYKSRCVIFRHGNTEYILPRMVIFKAFYGMDSITISALCSGDWPTQVQQLLSFRTYVSGIFTDKAPTTGPWHIVLQPGVDEKLAAPLALLWCDAEGRKHATSLHTDSLQQNQHRRGSEGRHWFASAEIPHRLGPNPFEMTFQGYELRARNPSRPEKFKRFMVSAIVASSWSLPDQLIFVESHTSNAEGEEKLPVDEDRSYRSGRPSVEGDQDALATSDEDPDATESVNIFHGGAFRFLNEPKVEDQKKALSQQFAKRQQQMPSGASSLVSGGDPTHAAVAPAPAEIRQLVRQSALQFEFLIRALEALHAAGKIDMFEPIEPVQSDLTVVRNELRCWSLLKQKDREKGRVPKKGWEVVKGDAPSQSEVQSEREHVPRHARAVLILRIQINDRRLVLFEIEPRPKGPTFVMFVFEEQDPIDLFSVELVLNHIRDHEGIIPDDDLSFVFSAITSAQVFKPRHSYKYASVDPAHPKRPTPAIGLNTESLRMALRAVFEA